MRLFALFPAGVLLTNAAEAARKKAPSQRAQAVPIKTPEDFVSSMMKDPDATQFKSAYAKDFPC